MKNYEEALKYQREINGYSQSALSKATGISQPKISYYENGLHAPTIDDCITLAQFYGCTLDTLVGLDNDEEYADEKAMTRQNQNSLSPFDSEFAEIINDKNFIQTAKLFKAITPELRALTLGYIVGLLQTQKINTSKILGY